MCKKRQRRIRKKVREWKNKKIERKIGRQRNKTEKIETKSRERRVIRKRRG